MAEKSLRGKSDLPYTLRSIYLRNGSVYIADEFDPLLPGQQLVPLFRTGGARCHCRETRESEGADVLYRSCAFTLKFEFAYTYSPDGRQPTSDEEIEKLIVARITAEITCDYLMNLPELPTSEDLQRWAAGNVLLHAWPYWREFCHSTMLRMNLPITMIPLAQIATEIKVEKAEKPARVSPASRTKPDTRKSKVAKGK